MDYVFLLHWLCFIFNVYKRLSNVGSNDLSWWPASLAIFTIFFSTVLSGFTSPHPSRKLEYFGGWAKINSYFPELVNLGHFIIKYIIFILLGHGVILCCCQIPDFYVHIRNGKNWRSAAWWKKNIFY